MDQSLAAAAPLPACARCRPLQPSMRVAARGGQPAGPSIVSHESRRHSAGVILDPAKAEIVGLKIVPWESFTSLDLHETATIRRTLRHEFADAAPSRYIPGISSGGELLRNARIVDPR